MWELQIEIETSCALNCVHCSSLTMRQHTERCYSDDDLLNFIKLFESSLHIYYTGGEPINYEKLPVLCKKITEISPTAKMGLYSTGNHSKYSFVNETFAKELKDNGIYEFYFSIYSDVENEHDRWTKTKGSLANTILSINSMKKIGIISKAHIVLTRVNFRKIDKVLKFCERIGIEEARILRLTSCGAAKRNWDEIGIHYNEQNKIIEELINNKYKYNIKLSFSGYPQLHPCRPFEDSRGCEAGIKLLYIDIHGDVYPCACSKESEKIFNIKELEKAQKYIHSEREKYRLKCLNNE